MEWGKAGRPPKRAAENQKEKASTRSETHIAKTEREALRMLSAAVLRQWIEDGRPGDIPIEWVSVLRFLLEVK